MADRSSLYLRGYAAKLRLNSVNSLAKSPTWKHELTFHIQNELDQLEKHVDRGSPDRRRRRKRRRGSRVGKVQLLVSPAPNAQNFWKIVRSHSTFRDSPPPRSWFSEAMSYS